MALKIWRRVGEIFVVADAVVYLQSVGFDRASFLCIGPADCPIDRYERLEDEDLRLLREDPKVAEFLQQYERGTVERGEGGR